MTVLLRYAAPLAAFGTTGRYDQRPTDADPSLSAIQGMVAAAAGVGRHTDMPDWIRSVDVAIRVDADGTHLVDYHTVNDPPARRYRHLTAADQKRIFTVASADTDAKGRPVRKKSTVVSTRGYRADATYLVAIADPTGNVTDALSAPRWAIYAGRKACPLTEPFLLGHTPEIPTDAITTTPTVAATDGPVERRAVLFTDPGGATRTEDRTDDLVAFRHHRPRRRWHTTVSCPTAPDWFTIIELLKETV